MALAMPVKDCDNNPDVNFGWSADRYKALGVACVEVLAQMIGECLRAKRFGLLCA